MPRDFFGKGRGGPSPESEELEKEAAREIERLTSRERQAPGLGATTAYGGGMGVAGLGGGSPLEAMAAQMAERRNPRRRRRGMASLEEDRAGFKGGGFIGAAANTGSVGSALGFGGGVGPGGRKKPPPPDALPLGYRPPEDYGQGSRDDDGDDSDDDVGVTEMALRDHAERFGRGMEETMIRSDPAEAENMREQAMRQFMERQAGRPAPVRPPTGPVNIRKGPGGRLRVPDRDEPTPDAEDDEAQSSGGPTPPPAIEVSDNEQIRIAEDRARVAEERARVAEDRAQVAEERARLAEERSAYAEARAWQAARRASETLERFSELEAVVEELSKQPPPEPEKPAKRARATKAAKAAKPAEAAPSKAKPAAAKAVKEAPAPAVAAEPPKAPNAVKKKMVAKKAAAAPREAARKEAPPDPPSSSRVGGVLGRRLAEAAQRLEQESAKGAPAEPAPAPASGPAPAAAKKAPAAAAGPARVVRKAPGAVKKRPARS